MSKRRGNTPGRDRYEPRRIIDPSRSWYIARTRAGADARATVALVDAGVDVWLPKFWTVTVRARRRREVSRLFFPGYLFAGVHDCPSPLFQCEHVADVLGADRPLRMEAAVVQAIADRLTGDVKAERLQAAALLRVGEVRSVEDGPFRGFLARVAELLANGRVKVDVGGFIGGGYVEIDPDMLGAA